MLVGVVNGLQPRLQNRMKLWNELPADAKFREVHALLILTFQNTKKLLVRTTLKEKNISRIYWLINMLLFKVIFTALRKTILMKVPPYF